MIYSYLYSALQRMKDIYFFCCNTSMAINIIYIVSNISNMIFQYDIGIYFFKCFQFYVLKFSRTFKKLCKYLLVNISIQNNDCKFKFLESFQSFFMWMKKMNAKHWCKRDGNAINYCQCNWNVLAMHTLQQRPRIHDIWLQSTWQTQLIPNWLGTGWQSTHWALSFWGVSWWSVSKRPSLIRYQV